jgi:hypothetical protein
MWCGCVDALTHIYRSGRLQAAGDRIEAENRLIGPAAGPRGGVQGDGDDESVSDAAAPLRQIVAGRRAPATVHTCGEQPTRRQAAPTAVGPHSVRLDGVTRSRTPPRRTRQLHRVGGSAGALQCRSQAQGDQVAGDGQGGAPRPKPGAPEDVLRAGFSQGDERAGLGGPDEALAPDSAQGRQGCGKTGQSASAVPTPPMGGDSLRTSNVNGWSHGQMVTDAHAPSRHHMANRSRPRFEVLALQVALSNCNQPIHPT